MQFIKVRDQQNVDGKKTAVCQRAEAAFVKEFEMILVLKSGKNPCLLSDWALQQKLDVFMM